jgi:predicted amino acid racemase
MSATGITVPPELDQDVRKWSVDHVATFLAANMEEYGLEDTDIHAVRVQKVHGKVLVRVVGEELERWGILGGPAERIAELVEELKVIKGLVIPGK